jgi:hypothetical protein
MFSTINKPKFFHSSHGHELEDAPDKPPVSFLTVIVLVCFAFVFLSAAVALVFTEKLVDARADQVNLGMGNQERLDYLAEQNAILSSAKKIEGNHYQIPIQQAMKMVVTSQSDSSAKNLEEK